MADSVKKTVQAGNLTTEQREALEREISRMLWHAEDKGELWADVARTVVQRVLDCVVESQNLVGEHLEKD